MLSRFVCVVGRIWYVERVHVQCRTVGCLPRVTLHITLTQHTSSVH